MLTRVFTVLLAVTGLLPVAAFGQQESNHELEEVIVTARFRDAELLKTSGSISVVQPATLFDRGARHLEDILNVLPNVNFSSGASRARFIQVRGVGDLEQFVDPKYFPSVGVTIDEVDMNGFASAAVMMDIQQIELLRGPQGTRFGTNALAGMVNIRSNNPTDKLAGYAQVGQGNFDSRNVEVALSGPLSESLLARVAVRQNLSDGFIHNDYLDRDDSNDRDEFSLRGKLRWQAEGDNYADLSVVLVDIDNGYDAFSLDNNRSTLSDEPGYDRQQSVSITGKSYWRINTSTVLATILSWSDVDSQFAYDEDWSNPDICNGFNACFPFSNIDQQDRSRNNVSIDSHLMSTDGGRLNWVAGLYAQQRKENFTRQYFGRFDSDYETRRYAIYGQLESDLSPGWRMIAGLRFESFADDYNDTNGLISVTDTSYSTGELTLQHLLDDGTLLYGTVARGVKPGGINTEANSVFAFMDPKFQAFMQDRLQFGSELLLNLELGIKGRYLDDRMTLRASAFYMDRQDAQLEAWIWDDVNFFWVGYLDSVPSGSNYGVELELDFRASDRLGLFAGIGWLKTNIDEITVVDLGAPGQATQSVITVVKDRDQAKAPEWQYNIGTRVELSDRASARLELEGRSDSFYGYYHNQKIEAYTLLNASLSYRLGAVTIRAWVRNLTNKDYAVHGLFFGNDPRKGYVNGVFRQLGEPRVYGVDVRYELN